MELLIAILFALNVFVEPEKTMDELKAEHTAEVAHAEAIINSHHYRVNPETGIIIIDETGN